MKIYDFRFAARLLARLCVLCVRPIDKRFVIERQQQAISNKQEARTPEANGPTCKLQITNDYQLQIEDGQLQFCGSGRKV